MSGNPVTTGQLTNLLSGNCVKSPAEAKLCAEKLGQLPSFSDYFSGLIMAHGKTPNEVFEYAGVERTSGYRILTGKRMSGRNILLRFALTLHLDLEEAQRLLRMGERAQMYPRIRRDALLIYAFTHGFTLLEAEEMLADMGERSLYEKI